MGEATWEPLREALLSAAVWAPSGDNTQPWRFQVDDAAPAITLRVDPARDPSPMNAGQRMARIALGAALENLLQTAEQYGWAATPEWLPHENAVRVGLTVTGHNREPGPRVGGLIPARVTNRRLYDRSPIAPVLLDRLRRTTAPLEGVRTHWIVDLKRLDAWSDLIARGDATLFGAAAIRRAFLEQVILDARAGETVPEGLPPEALELTAVERLILASLKRIPDRWLRPVNLGQPFAAKARKLVRSASGLCLIAAPDDSPDSDINVGRAMQRAWLVLTAEGLAAQPMMSLLVLENIVDHDHEPALVVALGSDRLAALRRELRALAPDLDGARPAFLLRFGRAPAPSGRAGRRPWQSALDPAASPVLVPSAEPT